MLYVKLQYNLFACLRGIYPLNISEVPHLHNAGVEVYLFLATACTVHGHQTSMCNWVKRNEMQNQQERYKGLNKPWHLRNFNSFVPLWDVVIAIQSVLIFLFFFFFFSLPAPSLQPMSCVASSWQINYLKCIKKKGFSQSPSPLEFIRIFKEYCS